MKKLIIQTAIFLLPLAATAQTIIHWEPELIVSDGSVYGNTRPRIALNGSNPVVVYGKGTAGILHSSVFNGSAFSAPVPILPGTMGTYLASWTGPDLAAKGDTLIVVFKASPMETGHVYAVRSVDGGISYSDTIRVNTYSDGVTWLPALDIDENGNPTVTYMMHDPTWVHPRYVVVHSTDQGLTFEPELDIAVTIPDEACDCCPAEYVIKGNQHALLYRNNDNNIRDIHGIYSNDDGLTYASVENVDQLNWSLTSCPSTAPHGLFNNDKLFSVFASRASGAYRVYVSQTSTNPTFTFENRTMMTAPTNTNGIQNYPRISGQNDTLVMVWQESESSNPEIFCSYTISGDVNDLVANKEMVNVNTSGTQSNPDILYKDGFAHLVYQDAISGSVIYRRGIFGTAGIVHVEEKEINIFPNPIVTREFFVSKNEVKEFESFTLTDVDGKNIVFQVEEQGDRLKIRSEELGIGEYFFHIYFANGKKKTIKIARI